MMSHKFLDYLFDFLCDLILEQAFQFLNLSLNGCSLIRYRFFKF